MQGRSAVRSVMDDTLRILTINNFPGFSYGHPLREKFSIEGFEAAPSPDTFHGERFENDGFCSGHTSYFSEQGTLRNSFSKLSWCLRLWRFSRESKF